MSSIKTTQIDGDVSVGRNVATGGKAEIAGSVTIGHNLKVDGWLEAPNIKGANKGVFLTVEDLRKAYPNPHDGWMAGVGSSTPFTAYIGSGGDWVATGGTIEVTVDMSQYTEGVAQLQEDIDEIAGRVRTNETNITSHTQQLTTLGNQLNTVEATANAAKTQSETNKESISKNAQNIANNASDIEEAVGRIDEVETTLEQLSETVGKNEAFYRLTIEKGDIDGNGREQSETTSTDGTVPTSEQVRTQLVTLPDGKYRIVVKNGSDIYLCRYLDGVFVDKVSITSPYELTAGQTSTDLSLVSFNQIRLTYTRSRLTLYGREEAALLYGNIGNLLTILDNVKADREDLETLQAAVEKNTEDIEEAAGRIDEVETSDLAHHTIRFGGIVKGTISVETIGLNNPTFNYLNVLWAEESGQFVLKIGLKYYNSWSQMSDYVDQNNLTPYTEKLYVFDNSIYMYDGSELKQVSGGAAIGNCYNVTAARVSNGDSLPTSPATYDTKQSAIEYAIKNDAVSIGVQITFAAGASTWLTFQYIGLTNDAEAFADLENWIDVAGQSVGDEVMVNVDALCGACTSAAYYTLEYAIAAITKLQNETSITYAKSGLVITYKVGETKWETKQFNGNVADFGEAALWTDFGGAGGTVETKDEPEEGGTDAFSTGGAYNAIPTDLKVDTSTEGVVKIGMVNAKGDYVGNEQQFPVGTGSGEASGTIVTITPEQSPLYAQAGGTVLLKASIRSVTTQGGNEQSNLIERVELYDRDTSTLIETYRLNKASSADADTYDFEFDLSSYFAEAGARKFRLVAYDDSDHTGSRNINVTAVDVTIKSEQTLNYTASTAVQVGGSTKTLPMYKFPNNASDKGILCTVEIFIKGEWRTLGTATISDTYSHSITVNPNNCAGYALEHGAYPLRIHGVDVASGVVGNYLHTAIMVVDSNNNERIIAMRWYSETETATVKQYETISIDFAVYDPTTSNVSATIIESTTGSDVAKQSTTCARNKTYTYSQRVTGYNTDGSVTIKLYAESASTDSQVAEFVVSGTLLDIEPVTAQQMFDMDMAGRSNNDADKSITDNGYTLAVTGANYTTNGFVKDSYGTSAYGQETDTGVMALRIAENVTAKLNYAPFNQASIETNGLAIQFRIKVKNVADDTARLISCISGGIGFYVTGKNVVFTTDNGATVAKTITAALQTDSVTDVAIIIEPSSQAPYANIGVVKMYFDGELIGACEYATGAFTRHATQITFDGTEGDLYLYNIRAWETYYSFEQSFNNYLLKMSDTDAMITEYEFNNGVMASQTAENTTKNRPQASALYNQGMPYFVLCKNPDTADTTDNYPNYIETLDGDKKTTRILDVYAYFPDRPWQDFKAVGVTVSNQGTTSSKRPIKNIKMKFKKATITLLHDRSEYTTAADLAKYDECAANAAKSRVQPMEGSVPTNIITVKVDYSESGGANNGASTQMYNELQRALGANYMTPAQNAYNGAYTLNTSIDSIPIAFCRTDQYSSDATSPSYGYFHAKGNWNDDKGDAKVFGFEEVEGYNKGCLNYGDFTELIAARDQTLDAYEKTLDKSEWDTEAVYVLSEFCGDAHKVFRYQDGAWVETTGTMTYSDGKWRISGDVVNPVECYELLTYNALDWFQGVNSVDDMIAAGSDGLPTWLTYYESRYPDDDNLNAAYEDGRKVPYTLYKWLKWCQECNHNITASDGNITLDGKSVSGTAANRLKKFQHELHNEANVYSMICYHLFTDYIAAVDQRSKNMMVGFYLDTDGKVRMYLNHLYDGDTILGSDNDCGLTIPAELDPNNDPNGYYQGHDSVLFKQLANADYIWLTDYASDADTGDTTKTTTVASICNTMRTTKLASGLIPFSVQGIEKYWITDRLEKWPKLVSSFDGIRKYIEASKESANYFYALHGLSIQRLRDYVETRFRFRDGFYGCGDIYSSMIAFRCTGTEMTVGITAAKDGYFGIGVDRANTMRESAYLKAGESTTLHSYNTNTGGGIMLYIFGADRIAELDLSNATPKQSGWDISELTLVKKITLGGEGYTPATSTGDELATLNLGQLPFLETLDVRNFPVVTIDATYCPRLKTVLASGSKLQGITPAETSPIATLELPDTMTALSFVNLPALTYPNGGLTIEGFANVKTLQLSGCANIDTNTLLSDAIDGAATITAIKVPDLNVTADTTILDALMVSGALGIGSDLDNACDGLTGRWVLNTLIEDDALATLQAYFPDLTIYNAQYTLICMDDTVDDPKNITNMDNGTGYGTGKDYVASGHVQRIYDRLTPVRGKLNEETGVFEGVKMSTTNYDYLADDATTADNEDALGNGYDFFVHCRHVWYKGINDFKNQKKYICWSSLENEPLSTATKINRSTLSDIVYQKGYAIKVTAVTTGESTMETSGLLQVASSYNVYKFGVEGMKQVRWPALNNASIGAVFTDADGVIIEAYNMAVNNTMFDFVDGDYVFIDVPDGAVTFYFTSASTNGALEAIAVDSEEIEAIEPDWCEDEFLGGIYQGSVDTLKQYRSLSNKTVQRENSSAASGTNTEWEYDDDGKPTNTPLSALRYTFKDLMNLAQRRGDGYQLFDYEMSKLMAILWMSMNGTRDAQLVCGYGAFNTTTGYADGIGKKDTYKGQMNGVKALGFESFFGCVWEVMDNVLVNVPDYKTALKDHLSPSISTYTNDAKWHIYDPIKKTERVVQGINKSGYCIARTKHGRHCDVIASMFSNDTSVWAKNYADGQWYTHDKCRVVGRSNYYGGAGGGLVYAGAHYASSFSHSNFGSRLAFRGHISIEDE